MDTIAPWWASLSPEVQAAFIAAAATAAAAIFGVLAVIAQIRSQGRQSRLAIAEGERRKIKASLYDDAVLVCRDLTDVAIDLATKLRVMNLELTVAARAEAAGLRYGIPSARTPMLATLFDAFSEAALRLIILVENRRIVDARIVIFRTALNSVLHDARKLMHFDFVHNLIPVLPVVGPDGALFDWQPPTVPSAEAVVGISERLIEVLDEAGAYAEDFLVEMQNLLLGDLFETTVAHRQPLDPGKRVITLDRSAELEQWFHLNSEWGMTKARAEQEARERFAAD